MPIAPVMRDIFPDFSEDELRRAQAAITDFLQLLWEDYIEEGRRKAVVEKPPGQDGQVR